MFIYDKKIDQWSSDMIKGIDNIWGVKISKNNPGELISLPFLGKYLDAYLERYGEKIFAKFNAILSTNYKIADFKYYLNTTSVSLHNTGERIISVSLNHAFLSYPTIIIHELFHILFYEYVRIRSNPIFKTLTDKELNDLKEIITVIINDIFRDCIDFPDVGYPEHKIIREKALAAWQKEGNFENFLIKAINLYKNNGQL